MCKGRRILGLKLGFIRRGIIFIGMGVRGIYPLIDSVRTPLAEEQAPPKQAEPKLSSFQQTKRKSKTS